MAAEVKKPAVLKEASGNKKKKKKAKKSVETYKIYIFKVLKQVHPDIGISSTAMGIMNSFNNDNFEKLVQESSMVNCPSMRSLRAPRQSISSQALEFASSWI